MAARPAIPRLTIWAASSLLLIAAGFKQAAGPIEGWGTFPHSVLVEVEVLLALGLASGWLQPLVGLTACGCFAIFSILNIYALVAGHTSCGCFGRLPINPWITLAIDFPLAVLLGVSLMSGAKERNRPGRTRMIVCATLAAMATAIVFWPMHGRAAADDEAILGTVSGNLIVLEPEKWVGKSLPLAQVVTDAEPLSHGEWIIILFHHNCMTCRKSIPTYLAAAAWPKGARLALVEIPPVEDDALIDLSALPKSGLKLKLNSDHEWFVHAPVVLHVSDGIVQQQTSGEDATEAHRVLRAWGML